MITKFNCYLCNSSRIKTRYPTTRDNKNLRVLECKNCGLVFVENTKHIFKNTYADSKMHDLINGHIPSEEELYNLNQQDVNRRILKTLPYIQNKKVLDFGCGVGDYLTQIKNVTCVSDGLEPELRFQESFNKQGLRVFTDVSELTGKYDVITLFHVIEHLKGPISTLKQLKNYLSPKGLIIIETPNANDALLTRYKNKAFANFTYWSFHLMLFTEETLTLIVNNSGLNVKNKDIQLQRFPLSNHINWLIKSCGGGHKLESLNWLNTQDIYSKYEQYLASLKSCDTLFLITGIN